MNHNETLEDKTKRLSSGGFSQCEECGLIERTVWCKSDKHKCGYITDPDFIPKQNLKLKIGRKTFIELC